MFLNHFLKEVVMKNNNAVLVSLAAVRSELAGARKAHLRALVEDSGAEVALRRLVFLRGKEEALAELLAE